MSRHGNRTRQLLAAAVAAASVLTACSHTTARSGQSSPPAAGQSNHDAAIHYGAAIVKQSGVTYQPDVVLIGGGPDAVRSVSADGLVWRMDGSAPGVRDLQVGRIMLATTLGAGRVLALRSAGSDVEVLLGPVALTDVIRDGTFASAQPIPLKNGLYYSTSLPAAGPPPASATTTASPGQHLAGLAAASAEFAAATTTSPTMPAPSATAPTERVGTFSMTPICCAGGLGLHIGYDNGVGRLSVAVQLVATHPQSASTSVLAEETSSTPVSPYTEPQP